jgi:hypothetical protein
MYLGDYVWFDPTDDVFCGDTFLSTKGHYHAGKIMKYTRASNPPVFWVTPLPVIHSASSVLPLWAIPEHLVKAMEDEDAMLAMLENE